MKIIYFIDSLYRGGGTQKFLVNLASGLAARGYNQSVISLNDNPDPLLINKLERSDTQVRVIGKFPLLTGLGILNTIVWLRKEKFDTAVTLLFVSDVGGRFMAHMAGIPRIISSLRAHNLHYNFIQRWLVRMTMPWADAVVLNSSSFREFAVAEEGVPSDKIYIIPNSVRIEDYHISWDKNNIRKDLSIPQDVFLIGSIGRLTHQKGFDLLIHALTFQPDQNNHLILIGKGEEIDSLRSMAIRLGIKERVHFIGFREDVPKLLSILDLYVQPSRYEGMPNTLLEAMAVGCPIVASAVDGINEMIEDGIDGLLVPPDDVDALEKAIQLVHQDYVEAKQRAISARRKAMTSFSVNAMVDDWEKVLVRD